jgi:hypothetical protein
MVGTDENGIRDVDSVVLGTGTESGICNLVPNLRQQSHLKSRFNFERKTTKVRDFNNATIQR